MSYIKLFALDYLQSRFSLLEIEKACAVARADKAEVEVKRLTEEREALMVQVKALTTVNDLPHRPENELVRRVDVVALIEKGGK